MLSNHIAAVILAAGLSRRLGRPKQLLMGRRRLLLAEVLDSVLRLEFPDNVLVLGNQAQMVQTALSGDWGISQEQRSRIKTVLNPDFSTGQASSVQAGLRALPEDCRGALFIMGDQAGLDLSLLVSIVEAFSEQQGRKIVRPFYGGQPGGPVMWPRRFFSDLLGLSGDTGGRRLFASLHPNDVHELHFGLTRRPWDIDTEDIYQAWLNQPDPGE